MDDKVNEKDILFKEIIKKNEKRIEKIDDINVDAEFNKIINKSNNEKENKVSEFSFDEIIKKSNKFNSNKIIKKKKEKVFKYKNYVFNNLNDIINFLMLEYKNKEENATNLLNDQQFLDWLVEKIDDDNLYKNWLKNVLS